MLSSVSIIFINNCHLLQESLLLLFAYPTDLHIVKIMIVTQFCTLFAPVTQIPLVKIYAEEIIIDVSKDLFTNVYYNIISNNPD